MLDKGPSVNQRCACPCGRLAKPGSKYADYERCRQRAYKAKLRARMEAAGLPVTLSLAAVPASPSAGPRSGDAQTGRKRAQKRRAPDLRISYRLAVDAVAAMTELDHLPRACAREQARDALRAALPPRLKDAA